MVTVRVGNVLAACVSPYSSSTTAAAAVPSRPMNSRRCMGSSRRNFRFRSVYSESYLSSYKESADIGGARSMRPIGSEESFHRNADNVAYPLRLWRLTEVEHY